MTSFIGENIKNLRLEIARTCEKCGRNPEEITLVAVSKTVGVEEIEEARTSGCMVFGENRVQAFLEKYNHFEGEVDFHMIGHLQTNKVRNIV